VWRVGNPVRGGGGSGGGGGGVKMADVAPFGASKHWWGRQHL